MARFASPKVAAPIAIAIAVAMILPIACADEADLPSPAEIQKLVDAQQYTPALRMTQRVLALTGSAAAAYDRYDMLMLRAECQLQLHQQAPATEALTLARKDAFAHQKLDRAADPIATIALVQRSHNYVYAPAIANAPKPIPILDRAQRGAAFLALLADDLPAATKRMAAVATIKALPPLMEIARSAGTLRAVEFAATRGETQTAPLTRTVAERAEQLLDNALLDSSVRLVAISQQAQNIVTELAPQFAGDHKPPALGTSTHRQGVSAADRHYLATVQGTCAKVSAVADEVVQALDGQDEVMTAVKAKADTLRQQVDAVLNDDYSRISAPASQ